MFQGDGDCPVPMAPKTISVLVIGDDQEQTFDFSLHFHQAPAAPGSWQRFGNLVYVYDNTYGVSEESVLRRACHESFVDHR